MLKLLAHRLTLGALALVGPCFQLRIDADVDVERDGSSTRTIAVESTDAKKAAVVGARDLRSVEAIAAVPMIPMSPPSPTPTGGVRWTATRRVEPGETAKDVEIGRPEGGPRAMQQAAITIDDYIVFRRYHYRERIRDGSDPIAQDGAVRRLGSVLAAALQRTASDLLGSAYDLERLDTYLRGPALNAFIELWSVPQEMNDDTARGSDALASILKRESIDVDFARLRSLFDGTLEKPEDFEALGRSLRDGMIKKTASLLGRRDAVPEKPGEPVRPEEISFLQDTKLVADAFERAVVATTGSKDGVSDVLHAGGAQLYGCFGGGFMDPSLGAESLRWRTTLRMPGTLLRTNGVPLRDGSILWLFLSGDLSLKNTLLEAESIVVTETAVSALGGARTSIAPEDVLELLSEYGSGREHAPKKDRMRVLRAAVEGDAEALKTVQKGGDYEDLRRILQIGK